MKQQESKLEQAANSLYQTGEYRSYKDCFVNGFIAGAKSEAAKEYWQSLTTPAGNVKSFLDVLTENYQAQIAGFYNDDKTDAERAKRNAVIEEYQDLIAIFKSGYTTPSKPHTVEEGQTQEPVEESEIEELREEAHDLLIKIAPSETFGEDADCERLYNIIDELAKAASIPQSSEERQRGWTIQSSTEEEKELWKEIVDLKETFFNHTQGKRDFINEVLSTYKISKR